MSTSFSSRFSSRALDWIAQHTHISPAHIEIEQLKGSTSSSLFRIQSRTGNDTDQFVLRLIDNAAWLAEEPDVAAHEMAALREANQAGLRAPRPIATATPDDALAGFVAPVVLMSRLEGQVELRPADPSDWLAKLAGELAQIHRLRAEDFQWAYRSWVPRATVTHPGWNPHWSRVPQRWRRAVEINAEPAPAFTPVFVHRDYHPTNILWQGEGISGIVDWASACRGPAGIDVAHCRNNVALMFGVDAAEQFLAHYQAAAPDFVHNPYWEIDSTLDMWGAEGPGFYPPWQQFGLDTIPLDVLRRRADDLLVRIMAQL